MAQEVGSLRRRHSKTSVYGRTILMDYRNDPI